MYYGGRTWVGPKIAENIICSIVSNKYNLNTEDWRSSKPFKHLKIRMQLLGNSLAYQGTVWQVRLESSWEMKWQNSTTIKIISPLSGQRWNVCFLKTLGGSESDRQQAYSSNGLLSGPSLQLPPVYTHKYIQTHAPTSHHYESVKYVPLSASSGNTQPTQTNKQTYKHRH